MDYLHSFVGFSFCFVQDKQFDKALNYDVDLRLLFMYTFRSSFRGFSWPILMNNQLDMDIEHISLQHLCNQNTVGPKDFKGFYALHKDLSFDLLNDSRMN